MSLERELDLRDGTREERWDHWTKIAKVETEADQLGGYIRGGARYEAFLTTLSRGRWWADLEDYQPRLAGLSSETTSMLESTWREEGFGPNHDHWHFFVTPNGYMGYSLSEVLHDDSLWVCAGASMPLVLRRCGGGYYRFVGAAYVHGMMHGEIIDMMRAGKVQFEQIDIV